MPAATPAQLRALERAIAPRLTRPEDVVVETRQDGTLVMHPGEGYYHVAAAVLREGGRFELMCLEQPSIGDYAGHDHDGHPGRPAELR